MAGSFWSKYTGKRVSRRRVLQSAGAAGAAAGAIWIVGCGSDDDDGGSTTPNGNGNGDPGTPVRGGTYRVASTADFDTFDPYIGIAASVGYFPRLYNVLVNFSALDSSFRFDDLSTGFEHPDDVTYIFSIRPGVKVGPNELGVPERDLDAEDVQVAYDRIKTLPQSNAAGFINKIVKQEVGADRMTYTLTMDAPYAYFQNRIGSAINTIVPREALADGVLDQLKQKAAGAGPFILTGYTEGQGATLARNPNYYLKDGDQQLPYIDGMDVKIITERASIRTAFQTNQLDVYTAQNVDESNELNRSGNYVLRKDPVNTFIAVTLNPTREPWDDERIRLAALYAIDRQAYIDRVYSGEAQANGLVHWPQGDLALSPDELEELQPYDPERSRALIREATGQDRISINVMWPAESTIEEHNLHLPIWQAQMEEAGFDINPQQEAFGTWLERYTNLDYDTSLSLNQVYEYAEFNMDFQHSEGPARNNIYTIGVGALYPEIDAEIDRVKGITDPEEFTSAMHDLQRQIYAVGPAFIPLVSPYSFTLYQERVKNLPEGIGSSGLYVNNWWLDPPTA
jgi:ABC-type transport system substrate-binding protein